MLGLLRFPGTSDQVAYLSKADTLGVVPRSCAAVAWSGFSEHLPADSGAGAFWKTCTVVLLTADAVAPLEYIIAIQLRLVSVKCSSPTIDFEFLTWLPISSPNLHLA